MLTRPFDALVSGLNGDSLSRVGSAALDSITSGFGWAYLLVSLGFLVFLVFPACSRYGR